MTKNTKDKHNAKRLLARITSSFPTCIAISSDSKHELNHTRGIPVFTSRFDETLYVNGLVTARNRSMAMANNSVEN